jgi:segregation and condensation protein A
VPGWRVLSSFLPRELEGTLLWKSAMASTFTASLELCREGALRIRQDGAFGPIYLASAKEKP